MRERRERLEHFFGDIVPQGTIEAVLYEGLPSTEDEYVNLVISKPKPRRYESTESIEIPKGEVRKALAEIREEMMFRA